MKIALLILVGAILVLIVSYFFFRPRSIAISFFTPNGDPSTLSRPHLSFEPVPSSHVTNGFNNLESYITRLLVPTNRFKSLGIFTLDGKRGTSFAAKGGQLQLYLTVDCPQEAEREAAIRAFFKALGITPKKDYLFTNGGVLDSARIMEYPVQGSSAEVTALTKRILKELFEIAPTEALDFTYREK